MPRRSAREDPSDPLDHAGYLELTTIGRRTGLPRPVQLSFAHRDGQVYLLAHHKSQWVRNLRANPEAKVRVGRRRLPVVATFPEDRETALAVARALFTAKYGGDYVRNWYDRPPRIPVVLRVRPGPGGRA